MTRGRPATPLGTLGEINVKQLPNGKYQADARYRTTSGKTTRIRARGTSKTAATRNLKEKARDADATTSFQQLTNTSTLTALLNHWLPRHQVAPTTHATYTKAITKHINPTIGHARLNELTTPMLQTFLEQLTPEVSQVLFRLSRWENLEHAKEI